MQTRQVLATGLESQIGKMPARAKRRLFLEKSGIVWINARIRIHLTDEQQINAHSPKTES
jgi:hypothetical protein